MRDARTSLIRDLALGFVLPLAPIIVTMGFLPLSSRMEFAGFGVWGSCSCSPFEGRPCPQRSGSAIAVGGRRRSFGPIASARKSLV